MSDTATTETRGTAKGGKRTVRRSLLELQAQRHETDKAADDRPIELTESKTPCLSLGVVTEDTEFIFPYIGLQISVRMGQQYSIAIGEYELTLYINNEVANERGWESPAQDISKGIHSQTIEWIHHRPEYGLSVEVTKREKDAEGGGEG